MLELFGGLLILIILVVIYLGHHIGYVRGYNKGDYDGYRRYHNNQICIDCESLLPDKCKNPKGYDGNGYCKWKA